MAFLAPLFFAALPTFAIPILIHLTQRERKQVVEFPSLMFLEKIPYQSVRRRTHSRLAAAGDAAGCHSSHRPRLRTAVLRATDRRTRQCIGTARSGHPPRSLLQHGLRRSLDARASGRAPGRARADGNRSRHAHPVRRQCSGRSPRDRGSLARHRGDRRREAQRRSHAIRPGVEARAARARRLDAADARSRHDQRFSAQRMGARRKPQAARRHDVQARADHRRAAGEPDGLERAAAADDVLRAGACDASRPTSSTAGRRR